MASTNGLFVESFLFNSPSEVCLITNLSFLCSNSFLTSGDINMDQSTDDSRKNLCKGQIKRFIDSFKDEALQKVFAANNEDKSNSFLRNDADATTANALNTDTVVIMRRKKPSLKKSPLEGVDLVNYRLKTQDVAYEVFDWVYHYLSLK